MPSRAIRDKERRWKLARNAVWGCVPARLSSEVPATWVPATELVPQGALFWLWALFGPNS